MFPNSLFGANVTAIVALIREFGNNLMCHPVYNVHYLLLQATSELESKEASYLSVRLANDGAIQEKLDLARIAAARASSMMECVNQVSTVEPEMTAVTV